MCRKNKQHPFLGFPFLVFKQVEDGVERGITARNDENSSFVATKSKTLLCRPQTTKDF